MARMGSMNWMKDVLPRFPLEMAVASLATFLGTAIWFDLPHRGQAIEPAATPVEKVSLQAEPLPIQMFRPSEDHQTSAFMEAVALSHVAPLRPESEIDRALTPPPAVQVMARAPTHEKPKVASAPRPVAAKVATVSPATSVTLAPAPALHAAAPRPPASIPPTALQPVASDGQRFGLPTVREAANSARVAVSGSLDSLGRSVESLIHWR